MQASASDNEPDLRLLESSLHLTTVRLSGLHITDGAVLGEIVSKRNNTLTELDLRGASIDDQGALVLSSALLHNKTLRTLTLLANHITSVGARHLGATLEVNATLHSINLAGNLLLHTY
jgi:hypothetical protein